MCEIDRAIQVSLFRGGGGGGPPVALTRDSVCRLNVPATLADAERQASSLTHSEVRLKQYCCNGRFFLGPVGKVVRMTNYGGNVGGKTLSDLY